MTDKELHSILDKRDDYIPEVVEFVEKLLGIEHAEHEKPNYTDNVEKNSNIVKSVPSEDLNKEPNNKHFSSVSIAIICGVIITTIAIAVIIGVTYCINAKIQEQNAITRINSLCDEINRIDNANSHEFSNAESMLTEIKTLIDENNLDEMYEEKYNKCKTYINDLDYKSKIYDIICSNTFNYNKNLDSYIFGLSDAAYESIMEECKFILCDYIEGVLIKNSLETLRNDFLKERQDKTLVDTVYLSPDCIIGSDTHIWHPNVLVYGGKDVTTVGINSDGDYINGMTTELRTGVISNIKNKGNGYAFVCVYCDGNFTGYDDCGNLYWYVGCEVSDVYVKNDILYFSVTKYTNCIDEDLTLSYSEVGNYLVLHAGFSN